MSRIGFTRLWAKAINDSQVGMGSGDGNKSSWHVSLLILDECSK